MSARIGYADDGKGTVMRGVVAGLIVVLAAGGLAHAQVGQQLVVTMHLAGPVKPAGGAYYIAFTADDALLTGPQSDSSNWSHYVLYRGGRFFFGRIPPGAFRPFEFVAVRPPQPYIFGQVLAGGRGLRVRVALSDLQTGPTVPRRVKVNFVTVDDRLTPLDALGEGAGDRFAFLTVDLRRDTYVAGEDRSGDASDPSFDITGGDVQVTVP
ncbi:MAG TPA: hypothetical protein VFJ45_12440 [bacterium]|nr:hypothetical protein [bacterium]